MLDSEAILYYAGHPVEFVEDIIRATPDPKQADILRSVAANPMTSVRSGHGVGKSTVEAWTIIYSLPQTGRKAGRRSGGFPPDL